MLQYIWHVYVLLKSSDTSSSSNTKKLTCYFFKRQYTDLVRILFIDCDFYKCEFEKKEKSLTNIQDLFAYEVNLLQWNDS